MEKQAFALVKFLKAFHEYILHSEIIAFIPHSTMKDILRQQDSVGRWGKWIAKIQEYDLDIKPTKLIKGQGLAKLMTDSIHKALGINAVSKCTSQEPHQTAQVSVHKKFTQSFWYTDIVYYL